MVNHYHFRNCNNDKLCEECGIVGIFGDSEAAKLSYLSLYALQHRGQEACGIVSIDKKPHMHVHKDFGLVGDSFTREILEKLPGDSAIGHVRYSTTGGRSIFNIQPFLFNGSLGPVALSHNGNLTNAAKLRKQLETDGSIFQSKSDTEVFMHLLAKSSGIDIKQRIMDVVSKVEGAYALLILTPTSLFALKDPYGFRPLVLGKKSGAYVVASESCALDLIDAKYIREIKPGEIVEINSKGVNSSFIKNIDNFPRSFCSFEPIYFSRPDSILDNETIYHVRKKMGRELAKEAGVKGDVVIAVPDSGVPMALGFSEELKISYQIGLVRNHYVGRTFIEPIQAIRDFGVKLKLNTVGSVLKGKDVIVIDDSIVRGTTSNKIIRMIRNAGAKKIHMRIGSPPITYPCYFGVDTPKREKLLAAQKNLSEMCEFIGADSLEFLSIKGLSRALDDVGGKHYCYGCFHGGYPDKK